MRSVFCSGVRPSRPCQRGHLTLSNCTLRWSLSDFLCYIYHKNKKSNPYRRQIVSRLPAFLPNAPVPSLFGLTPLVGEARLPTLDLDSQRADRESDNQVESCQLLLASPFASPWGCSPWVSMTALLSSLFCLPTWKQFWEWHELSTILKGSAYVLAVSSFPLEENSP